MFNVCPNCGEYSAEKAVDPEVPLAICPFCRHGHRFARLPLFIVTGTSGAGKSTVALLLAPLLAECVVLDADILWREELDTPADGYSAFRDLQLRLAKNIGQAGKPVLFCGSGLPEQFERRPERRYFSSLHYLALVCSRDVLEARLRARPACRRSGTTEFVARMLAFNGWLRANAATLEPPMTLLDTTDEDAAVTARRVAQWARARLDPALQVDHGSGGADSGS